MVTKFNRKGKFYGKLNKIIDNRRGGNGFDAVSGRNTGIGTEDDRCQRNQKTAEGGSKDVRGATDVLRKIMNVPDKAIPRELLEKAEAIGVFPSVVKAGFIIGGRGGAGVVARRTTNGWSAPVFYNIGGASVGAQIGVEKTDYIMLFMNEGALRELLNDKLAFEGNLSFAAGPIGRSVGAATNATLESGILIWSRSKGAFVGASIGGAVLTADNSKNQAFYKMNAGEILEKPESVSLTNISLDLHGFTDIVKFWMLGLPAPVLWGLVMSVLALLPFLGTWLIWIPAAVYLALEGSWVKSFILLGWGLSAVALIDNFLYPIIVGNRLRLHTLIIFISLVGGVGLFGAAGIVLGPLTLALTVALLDIWRKRTATQTGKIATEG